MSTVPLQYESFKHYTPFSSSGPVRANEYYSLPEGEPVELIRGRLIMSPAPTTLHQVIIASLGYILRNAETAEGGLSLIAPTDVHLSDDTVLQPDLLYVAKARRSIIGPKRVEGPPDLVVEILSPGTDRRDKIEKLDLYAQYEVPEYWIVEPNSQSFEFLLNEQGKFVVQLPRDDTYQSPRLPEIKFSLSEFWREIAQRMG